MINETLSTSINTLFNTVSTITEFASLLFGGVFGVYLALVIIRLYESKTIRKKLTNIETELHQLNKNFQKFLSKENNLKKFKSRKNWILKYII